MGVERGSLRSAELAGIVHLAFCLRMSWSDVVVVVDADDDDLISSSSSSWTGQVVLVLFLAVNGIPTSTQRSPHQSSPLNEVLQQQQQQQQQQKCEDRRTALCSTLQKKKRKKLIYLVCTITYVCININS